MRGSSEIFNRSLARIGGVALSVHVPSSADRIQTSQLAGRMPSTQYLALWLHACLSFPGAPLQVALLLRQWPTGIVSCR